MLNLNGIFRRNGYPCNFIDICNKRFLNNIFIDKKVYVLAPKKKLVCMLPLIGKKLFQLGSKLVKSAKINLSYCLLKVVFQSPYKLSTLFGFKNTLDSEILSNLVYHSCNAKKC